MRHFTNLCHELDETRNASRRVEALKRYFAAAPPDDAAWALWFLLGEKPRRFVPASALKPWAAAEAGIPGWLFEESLEAVGDAAETMALLLPDAAGSSPRGLRATVEERLAPLEDAVDERRRELVVAAWREMGHRERFVWNRILTGELRTGLPRRAILRALAETAGLDSPVIAHRLEGSWEPSAEFYRRLLSPDCGDADASRPYPFHLAFPLEGLPDTLGERPAWCAEWKFNGLRAQIVKRDGIPFIWMRGGEMITRGFPELADAATGLPDGTVLDGEILPWKDGAPLSFGALQKRIGRLSVNRTIVEEFPVSFMAFDLLESAGTDLRREPLRARRARLEGLLAPPGGQAPLLLSPVLTDASWDDLTARRRRCRELHADGIMLKRIDSPYEAGRHRGSWWKWKIEPQTIDAILLYAQPGQGPRTELLAEYTFGLWHRGVLVPVAKVHAGLPDEEIRRVDAFVRDNTLEKFGPVRSVKPQLVFEIAFEGVEKSARRKSGVAMRMPRIVKRKEKPAEEADTLEALKALLHGQNQ